jgi:hypothetical protein
MLSDSLHALYEEAVRDSALHGESISSLQCQCYVKGHGGYIEVIVK